MLTPAPTVLPDIGVELDEAAARRALRTQIARLEAEAGAMDPPLRTAGDEAAARPAAPRLLTLGELERTRDRLDAALRVATPRARRARRPPGGARGRCASARSSTPTRTAG